MKLIDRFVDRVADRVVDRVVERMQGRAFTREFAKRLAAENQHISHISGSLNLSHDELRRLAKSGTR